MCNLGVNFTVMEGVARKTLLCACLAGSGHQDHCANQERGCRFVNLRGTGMCKTKTDEEEKDYENRNK
jgi:hypothetical protein